MPIASAILTLIAIAGLWMAAGNSLGLWLGGFAVVALLLPPVYLQGPTLLKRLIDAAIVTDCVVVVWLVAATMTSVTLLDWFLCTVLLYSFAIGGLGVAHTLRALRLPSELAAAGTVLFLLGWLAAPVWLSHAMNDWFADLLSQYHVLFAVNSRLTDLGIWLEHPIIYRHTVLGQDVAYALPTSIGPTVLLHTLLGGCGVGFGILFSAWRTPTRALPPTPAL